MNSVRADSYVPPTKSLQPLYSLNWIGKSYNHTIVQTK